jgi:hypothetical protein
MLTKTQISTKVKTKRSTKARSYQLRLTITPQIQADLLDARKEYPYLDDIEIIKVWIGKGSQKNLGIDLSEPTAEQMLQHTSKVFQLGENWEQQSDNINYSKAKPVDWQNFSF